MVDITKAGTKLLKEGVESLVKTSVKNADGLPANSALNRLNLNKQLASDQQLSETGVILAGGSHRTPLRKANDLATTHGGKSEDFVKKSSSSHTAPDGTKIETHFEENLRTGQRFNQKTQIEITSPKPIQEPKIQQ